MAKRIVVADDSATIQRAFAMTFGAEDVILLAARSADEGLTLVRQVHADLVIADGMMAGRSGYDLCASIKSEPGLRSIPVYILTSVQQPYDEPRGRQCGAEGHFSKPFDTAVIIEQVRLALAKGPSFDAGQLVLPPPDSSPPIPDAARATVPQERVGPLGTDDDEYGEISVEMSPPHADPGEAELEYLPEPAPPPPSSPAPPRSSTPGPLQGHAGIVESSLVSTPASVPVPALISSAALFPAPQPAAVSAPVAAMRPSLIPGMRPGVIAPPRPGAIPARPAGAGAPPSSRPPATVSKTLAGLPAANRPIPGSARPGVPTARTVAGPPAAAPARPTTIGDSVATPAPQLTPPPSMVAPVVPGADPGEGAVPAPRFSTTVSPQMTEAVGSTVDQKMAALAARGPEYEAIAKLSRAIIEEIVWEIVPELAEAIIREHIAASSPREG